MTLIHYPGARIYRDTVEGYVCGTNRPQLGLCRVMIGHKRSGEAGQKYAGDRLSREPGKGAKKRERTNSNANYRFNRRARVAKTRRFGRASAKMSYRLQRDEALSPGAKRIALEQIDEALAYLDEPGDDLDEAVHESRKCFKKIRGLLRLFRKEIGEEVYQRENECFRDAGRLLSDLRDSAVRIETADHLLYALDDSIDEALLTTVRDTLAVFYDATRRRVVVEEQGLTRAAEMIGEARQRVEGWPIDGDSFSTVAGGLRKVYRRGHNRLDDASQAPTAEAFHEWRKRVKYLWYSTRILRFIWPNSMEVLADEIHDLSDYLGDDHDLAEFRALMQEQPSLIDDHITRLTIVSLIKSEREKLQARAFQQGRRIYAESPKRFVRRLGRYWDVAQTEFDGP